MAKEKDEKTKDTLAGASVSDSNLDKIIAKQIQTGKHHLDYWVDKGDLSFIDLGVAGDAMGLIPVKGITIWCDVNHIKYRLESLHNKSVSILHIKSADICGGDNFSLVNIVLASNLRRMLPEPGWRERIALASHFAGISVLQSHQTPIITQYVNRLRSDIKIVDITAEMIADLSKGFMFENNKVVMYDDVWNIPSQSKITKGKFSFKRDYI